MFKTGFPKDWSTIKKLMWLWLLQGAAAIIKTVTGTVPITLANALAHSIKSLTQFGKCEQRNLPSGYTQVEYIQGDGSTGYVGTGIVINSIDTEVEVDYQFTETTGAASPSMAWGYMGNSSNLPRWGFGAYGGKWLGSVNQTAAYGYFDINRHTAVLRVYMDGENPMWDGTLDGAELYTAASLPNTTLFTSNALPVTLFARNNNGTAGNFAPAKIYAFKVRKAGILVNNLIPCKTATAVGFYDTVTGTFIAGAGTLTAGADAVPTPSASMDLWTNNGVLRYGWHDIITTSQLSGYGTYVSPTTGAGNRAYRWFKDLPNGTYQFSVDGNYEIIVQWRDPADPADGTAAFGNYENLSEWITSGVVTLAKSTGGYGIAVRRTSGTSNITPSNFDGVLHVAEQGLYVDGTPEVLTVRGKNWFDKNDTSLQYRNRSLATTTDGYWWYGVGSTSLACPCLPNTQYTISGINSSTGFFRVATVDVDTLPSQEETYRVPYSYIYRTTQSEVHTFVTPSTAKWIIVQVGSNYYDSTLTTIQIEQGSSATAYEPYVAPQTVNDVRMLLGLGDTYRDTEDLISGLLTHKIGIKVLDGTETWTASSAYPGSCYTAALGASPVGVAMCSHFKPVSALPYYSRGCCFKEQYSLNLWYGDTRATAVADLTAFLAAQYAAGTPVILLYPLATPTTEQGTAHALHSYAGTTVVDAQTNVDPVTLAVEYMASA